MQKVTPDKSAQELGSLRIYKTIDTEALNKTDYSGFSYIENPTCQVCGSRGQKILGQRGNREYSGADSSAMPHVCTNIVKCRNCGFIFCNPAIKGLEHLERDHYNNPETYSAYLQNNPFAVYRIGQTLLREFKPIGKLLDIGAGKGDFVFMSEKDGYEAKGIEPSPRFCEYAREKYGVQVEQGYLGHGEFFRGEKFDAITLFHVIEHVHQPRALLATISQYLKEDGVVYIEVPNADAGLLRIADRVFRLLGKTWSSRLSPLHAPFHSMGYSPKSMRYLLENNGFQLAYTGTFSGKVRGYDIGNRVSGVGALVRNLVTSIVNFFPNRELVCVVARLARKNFDVDTVKSFGDEWSHFDQSSLSDDERHLVFSRYFAVFPWALLPPQSEGFDMGCGSGRWAKLAAPRVGRLNCIDASGDALQVARRNLVDNVNVSFIHASVDAVPLTPASQDFGYSLGVLHHVPDTGAALKSCTGLLKPGAPFLLYLYYRFDNRPLWFRMIWQASDYIRAVICRLPAKAKSVVTDAIAFLVYWPLARTAWLLNRLGLPNQHIPLRFYFDKSFYMMRTDSRDRFGTPLEQRFTRAEIKAMMESAGLENIQFSDDEPYWCAVGTKVS